MTSIGNKHLGVVSPAINIDEHRPKYLSDIPKGVVDGADRVRRIKELGCRALPEYPGVSMIPEIIVSAPAGLQQNGTAYDHVRHLATSYRHVISLRFGKDSRLMLRGRLGRHKHYNLFLQVAHRMFSLDIAPVCWCLFSSDVWVEYARGKNMPSVKWVYSPERITKHLEWFKEVEHQYSIRRSIIGAKHRVILSEWQEMWRILVRLNPTDRDVILEIVDLFFPDDTFEERVLSARVEAIRLQSEINHFVSLGGLWHE